MEYFDEYRLKTTKRNSYLIWRYIRAKLLKAGGGGLTPQETENLKGMVKLINGIDPTVKEEVYVPQEDGEITIE